MGPFVVVASVSVDEAGLDGTGSASLSKFKPPRIPTNSLSSSPDIMIQIIVKTT